MFIMMKIFMEFVLNIKNILKYKYLYYKNETISINDKNLRWREIHKKIRQNIKVITL